MTSVLIIYVESDDPICVHFVFKCKIINNAQILGEQSYMLLNIGCLQLVFIPMTCLLGRQTFFVLVPLCHHEEWGRFFYSLMVFSSFGILLSFVIFSKWYLQSCVGFGYLIEFGQLFILSHLCVWFLGFIGVLSKLYLIWFLKVLCMHIYYMYILWHAYFCWPNIYDKLHQILNG